MEGGNFKASLGYIVRPCLYKKKGEGGKKEEERRGKGEELVGRAEKSSSRKTRN